MNPDFLSTLIEVAHLYYDETLSQQEIADRLHVSRSLIAQYLVKAREHGIVRIEVVNPEVRPVGLSMLLKERVGLDHAVIVPNSHKSFELSRRAVAGAAADYLEETLTAGDTFGLAWGLTVSLVVDLLAPPAGQDIEVVPLTGESSHTESYTQINQLVLRVAQSFGGKPSFLLVPILLGSPELREAVAREESVRLVSNQWDRLSVACMGIGSVPPTPGSICCIGEDVIPRLKEAGAVGDILGRYFNIDGEFLDSGLERQLIAVSIDQLRKANRVVAVACGAEKSQAVLGALRTGLISALFIDEEMAERILTEIGK